MAEHLTAARREQIVDLYRRGEKLLVIEHLFNVTTSHISKLAKRNRLVLRGRFVSQRVHPIRNEQGGRKARVNTGPAA